MIVFLLTSLGRAVVAALAVCVQCTEIAVVVVVVKVESGQCRMVSDSDLGVVVVVVNVERAGHACQNCWRWLDQ